MSQWAFGFGLDSFDLFSRSLGMSGKCVNGEPRGEWAPEFQELRVKCFACWGCLHVLGKMQLAPHWGETIDPGRP